MWFGYSLIRAIKQPIDFDAAGYVWLSRIIIGNDPNQFDSQHLALLLNIRQMGYPILISPFVALSPSVVALRVSISIAQVVFYLVACLCVYKLIRLILNQVIATFVLCLMFIVPYPYFYTTEILTDSLSLSLAMIAISSASICVELVGKKRSRSWYILSLLAAAMAMSIRTDNQYIGLIVVLSGTFFWRFFFRGFLKIKKLSCINLCAGATSLLCLSLSTVLFRIPNWIITRTFLGVGSFEPPGYISSDQFFLWGLQIMKYFTITGEYGGGVSAANQFVDVQFLASLEHPWHYYFLRPFDGLLSIITKMFALLDWDVPFAYNNSALEFSPFVLSAINYIVVGNGVVGLFYFLLRYFKTKIHKQSDHFFILSSVFFLHYLAIHTLSHVEIRYGLPLFQLVVVSSGIFSFVLINKRRFLAFQLLVLVAWVPFSFFVSNWIRSGMSV
jgi:hypothetical protein